MTDIIVIRGAGDREAEDVVEALLYTDLAALERGRNEMDRRATAKAEKQLTLRYRAGLETGQLCEVIDAAQGVRYRGKITAVQNVVRSNPPEALSIVTLEVPTEFFT